MKKLLYLICLIVFLGSCEKSDDHPLRINTAFDHKILDGYFVTAIAFDEIGNTWIGTFGQGLIKYNSKETVVYNASNSIIPENAVIRDLAVDGKGNFKVRCTD